MKKRTKIVLCIALALCFISMIGSSVVQNNGFKTDVSVFTGSLTEVADMIRANNEAYGKDIQITFTESKTAQFSFMTLIPDNASVDNPVPAIVCVHGGSNTKEMQLNQYIELVRRGFVVVTMDMAGHGYSDQAVDSLTHGSLGSEAAVEYVMSLGCVDETQVGITGHSTGGNSSATAVTLLNTEGSTQRIAAYVPQCGTMGASQLDPAVLEGVITTIGVSYYDEFDTVYFDSPNILSNDTGKQFIRYIYPEFDEDAVTEGQWYTAEGPVDAPEPGQAIDEETAICLYNPKITHPMFHFTKEGTEIVVNGFYAAFGTPSGAEYIPADKQVWPVMVAFQTLGLIGFFMLIFPLVDILTNTRVFAGIKRKTVEISATNTLKDPREWILTLITVAVLAVISFFTFDKYFPIGTSLVNTTSFPARGTVGNGIGVWTIVCGFVLLAAIVITYFIRRLLYAKSGKAVANPFETGKLDSVSQFFLTMLFAFTVVAIMFIPVYIARYLFHVDFRICSFVVMAPEFEKLLIVFISYLPMWLLFYVPNAIFNANSRYSDAPGWLTTTICAVANSIALIVYIIVQYHHLYTYDSLWSPDGGMAAIAAFAVAPCLIFAAYSARYIYNKTGNAWAAGGVNALVMCIITIIPNGITTDLLLPW